MTWHQNSISPPKSSLENVDEEAEYNVILDVVNCCEIMCREIFLN